MDLWEEMIPSLTLIRNGSFPTIVTLVIPFPRVMFLIVVSEPPKPSTVTVLDDLDSIWKSYPIIQVSAPPSIRSKCS